MFILPFAVFCQIVSMYFVKFAFLMCTTNMIQKNDRMLVSDEVRDLRSLFLAMRPIWSRSQSEIHRLFLKLVSPPPLGRKTWLLSVFRDMSGS